jgi:hypothetical protein
MDVNGLSAAYRNATHRHARLVWQGRYGRAPRPDSVSYR